jgi:hypothetical protein
MVFLVTKQTNCDNCKINFEAQLKSVFQVNNTDIFLCIDCKKIDGLLIRRSIAKYEYCLEEEDLNDIKSNKVINYPNPKSEYYYYKEDLLKKAIEKYGSFEQFTERKEKREKRSYMTRRAQKIKETNIHHIKMARKRNLEKELLKNGIKMRNDSKLCESYIQDGDESGNNIEEIVRIMVEMEFLYKRTQYGNILQKNKLNDTVGSFRTEEQEEEFRKISKKEAVNKYVSDGNDVNIIPFSLLINNEIKK